jgi:hypothetical protein
LYEKDAKAQGCEGAFPTGHGARTDRDGRYVIENIAAGDYCIHIAPNDRGPTMGYGPQWFDGVFDKEVATPVTLAKGAPTVQDMYLVKAPRKQPATLKGTLVKEERPRVPRPPMPTLAAVEDMVGFTVKLFNTDDNGKATTLVNSAVSSTDGTYELTGLQPGSYKIYIAPPETSDYPGQWFDRVFKEEYAREIFLADGKTREMTLTVTTKPATAHIPAGGTGGKWACSDGTDYDKPQRGTFCWRVPAGLLQNGVNVRIIRRTTEMTETALSATTETTAPDRPVSFYFDVEAYWTNTGEGVQSLDEAVVMSVPYVDPDDLVYTPTGAVSSTKMSESLLRIYTWGVTSTGTVTDTNPITDTTTPTTTMLMADETNYWNNAAEEPWCTATDCGQTVDTDEDHVLLTTNQFYQSYALVESKAPMIYLPMVQRIEATTPTTPTEPITPTEPLTPAFLLR